MRATVNGTDLYYETVGAGPPILVMHGGLGWDHTYFRPFIDALGELATVIYYDHRGNGRSDRPSRWDLVTHATMVDDAEALRRHLDLDRIVVFGHSYGGFLAQEYALRYPESLRGLALCSCAPVLDYAEVVLTNAKARGTPEQVEAVVRALSTPPRNDEQFRELTNVIIPLYFHDMTGNLPETIMARTHYSAAAYQNALVHCLPNFNVLRELSNVTTPTLVVSGASDWIMPFAFGAERIAAAIATSHLVRLERSGHFPFAEEPAVFGSVVRDWFSKLA